MVWYGMACYGRKERRGIERVIIERNEMEWKGKGRK
jgi:hypothetical protein